MSFRQLLEKHVDVSAGEVNAPAHMGMNMDVGPNDLEGGNRTLSLDPYNKPSGMMETCCVSGTGTGIASGSGIPSEYHPLDDLGTQNIEKKKGAAEIGDNSVDKIVLDIPMKQNEGLAGGPYNEPSGMMETCSVSGTGTGTASDFGSPSEYQPLDDLGTQNVERKKGAAEIGDNSVDKIVLDIPMKQNEGLPGGLYNGPTGMMETCSVSGPGTGTGTGTAPGSGSPSEYYPLDDFATQNIEKKKGAAEIGDNSVDKIVLEGSPPFENGRPPLLPLINNEEIDVREDRIIEQVSDTMSFRQLLEKQVMLSAGGVNAAAHMGMNMDMGPKDLGSGDRSLSLELVYKKLEMKSPGGLYNEPSGMMEICSVSGTGTASGSGSPSEEDNPKPQTSDVAQQLDSPMNVRKHLLFGREEESSSKRMKALEWRPSQALPLQKMTLGENLQLFRSVFDELERSLQSANRDCERWKSCMQELCKGLNQHFGGLPMKDSDWQDILNEEPVDSIETQQARAYMKKATKIIKEQDEVIQVLKDKEEEAEAEKINQEDTKKLENEILALRKDIEMEQERRKVAEVRAVNLEDQLVQMKEKLRRVFED